MGCMKRGFCVTVLKWAQFVKCNCPELSIHGSCLSVTDFLCMFLRFQSTVNRMSKVYSTYWKVKAFEPGTDVCKCRRQSFV